MALDVAVNTVLGILVKEIVLPTEGANGVIPTSMVMSGTASWRLQLTQFELAFLLITILNVTVLRALEILPINLNDLLKGEPTGRRKKRGVSSTIYGESDFILKSLLQIMLKLDIDECIGTVLCEQQEFVMNYNEIPLSSRNRFSEGLSAINKELEYLTFHRLTRPFPNGFLSEDSPSNCTLHHHRRCDWTEEDITFYMKSIKSLLIEVLNWY